MSKRAYPQDPAVPTNPAIPPGGGRGNYPRQYSYPSGPPGGVQAPGGSGYPQHSYGQAPPTSQGLGVPPSGYGPPGPAGQAVGRSLSGPPPPTNLQHTGGGVVGGAQAPPTSVAPLTSGVTNMQLGPPNAGTQGPRPQMMTTGRGSHPAPPPTAGQMYNTGQPQPPPPTSSGQAPPTSSSIAPPPTGPLQPRTQPGQPPSTTAPSGLFIPTTRYHWDSSAVSRHEPLSGHLGATTLPSIIPPSLNQPGPQPGQPPSTTAPSGLFDPTARPQPGPPPSISTTSRPGVYVPTTNVHWDTSGASLGQPRSTSLGTGTDSSIILPSQPPGTRSGPPVPSTSVGLFQPGPPTGSSSSGGLYRPPLAAGPPPPPMGHIQPTPAMVQIPPRTVHGPPPTGLGPPPTGQGPPPTGLGPPPTGQGPPPTGLGPPPTGQGPPPTGLGPPPTGLGPPPPSGQVPPPTGQIRPPPSGQGPPPPIGQVPPPMGQIRPPPIGQVPPPPTGQVPPPTVTSHGYLGQRPGGLMSAPSGGAPPPPSGPSQVMSRSGPGGPPPTPPFSQPGGMAQADPNLQPVNLMESRTILPSSPITPPVIALPNNLSKFAPDPKVFCCTMNTVPATNGLLNKLKLPFAIHIHPFKDMSHNDCPVIHPNVIIRCRMCRAYVNPYVTFIDSRHWRCNLCFRPNTLPEDFDYNPHSGKHGDRSHRVELRRSCVEYIAPSEYMVRPPQPCVFYFLIDVSFSAVQTGLLGVVCKCLLENLERLPGDARTMVGVLTYDSSLHFYNLNSDLSQPQMLVVSDIDDVFLPCPDSLLVTLKDSKELIRTLLEDLPRMFADNKSVHSALGPALQAATKLLHPIGGRITVLQTAIPNVGPGALKYRDVTPSATKMDTLCMSPASDFYKKLALDCSSQQIAVDLFAFGSQFMDLSTISCISKFSSGQVSYYPDFHHKKEVPRDKFEKDFRRYLTRKIGFEAVMRIRCTDGLSLHTFHGNFFVRSTDLLSLPNVNPDHGFTMNLAIDENLKDVSMACFQAALLYTSSRGERRIRVHTLSLPVSSQLSDIYAKLNIQAIAGVLGNMAVDRASSSNLGDAREALLNIVIDATKMYRSNFASSMQASQFTLPATLRLLPLFMIALLKNPAFSLNSKVSYDFRTQAMNLIKSTPLDYLCCLLYPRLYALHMITENCMVEREDGKEELAPPILQLSSENMTRYGIFLMDYGLGIYIWVAKDAPQAMIQKIFGVPHFGALPEVMTSLPQEENDISPLVNKLVKQIRTSRQIHVPLQVIREDGPHRLLFIDKMIDDRTDYGTSYYEFLTHVSRQLSK